MDKRIRALLPVGSVIRLNEPPEILMIAGYLQEVENRENGAKLLYDYIGFPYPYGFLDEDHTILFTAENIKEVLHRGYEDPERTEIMNRLAEAAKETAGEKTEGSGAREKDAGEER